MVIISGIVFIAASYNNCFSLILPELPARDDAAVSTPMVIKPPSPASSSSSIIFALI